MKSSMKWMAGLSFVLMALTLCGSSTAAEIKEADAIKAIIGEAGGDGPEMMDAIAHAIRNRGHLRGVHGKDAEHTYKKKYWDKKKRRHLTVTVKEIISPELWQQASKSWHESEDTPDITQGADHWFSREDLEKLQAKPPRWFKKLKPTITMLGKNGRSTTFYRSGK